MNHLIQSLFEKHLLTNQATEKLGENTFVVTKWDWDYLAALMFQEDAKDLVQQNPQIKFFIFCNHPSCFTNGRGLQKGKNLSSYELKDFQVTENLPFPLYQISRGGGLTFHHLGQLIFYPILKLNADSLTLRTVITEALQMGKQALEKTYHLNNLSIENELLGIWSQQNKLGSLGLAVERFVTFHGLAINLSIPNEMRLALKNLNPCGLSQNIYSDVATLTQKTDISKDDLYFNFYQELKKSALI